VEGVVMPSSKNLHNSGHRGGLQASHALKRHGSK
jgi:hypothetical protein